MPLVQIVQDEARTEAREGPAQVLGTGLRLAPLAAARLNAVAGHVLDYDANFNRGMVFGPAAFLPALLALAQARTMAGPGAMAGARLLQGFAIATEICRCLAEACSPQPYAKARDSLFYLGWFNTALLAPIGIAGAAAWMLGLDAQTSARALAIAAVQAGGLRIGVGSDMKPLMVGRAAETGLRAALLAEAGAEAPLNALEGHRGFLAVINQGRWTPEAFATLGRFDDAGASLKLYPACSSVQAAAEALARLLAQPGVSPGQITALHCAVTPHIRSNLTYDRPETVTQAQFSIAYALGCILAKGDFTAQHLRSEMLQDSAIRAAMDKITMRGNLDYATPEEAALYPEGTRVTLDLADGRQMSLTLDASTGKPVNPMSDCQMFRKFLANATPTLGQDRARALLADLQTLESHDDLTALFAPEMPPWH